MKYIIVNYLKLNELPPAISVLECLNEIGATYISLYSESEYMNRFPNILFKSINIKEEEYTGQANIKEKIKYKKDSIRRLLAKRQIIKIIDECVDNDTTIWFLHESTVLSLGERIKKYPKYLISLYELDAAQNDNNKLSSLCETAQKIIVPEETRAHIIQAFLGLNKRPSVIHNKPLITEGEGIDDDLQSKITQMNEWRRQGKRIYIYAGIFLPERKLDAIIRAFKKYRDKCILVFIGRNSYYLEQLSKEYSGDFEYLGFVAPPNHLELIKRADVGILTYVAQNKSINAIFCAPNKIFEYGYFKLPVLGNDIPGLKNIIYREEIGACFENDNIDDIEKCILNIENNYELYSDNIKKYTDSIDVKKEILSVL